MVHIGRYHLVDSCMLKPMSPSRCTHVMTYVCRTSLMLPTIGRYHHADACRPWEILSSRCAHAATNVWRPWLFLSTVGRCRFANTRWPQLILLGQCTQTLHEVPSRSAHDMSMHAGLCWCNMPLADIAWEIRTFNVFSCKPLLKPHTIGRYPLADAYVPR